MYEGHNKALLRILNRLSKESNCSVSLIVDEHGLLVSESINKPINKNSLAVLSSLLNTILNRFTEPLAFKQINFLILNTSKGTLLTKEIPLRKWNRSFILSLFFDNKNLDKSIRSNSIFMRFIDFILNGVGILKNRNIQSNGSIITHDLIKKVNKTINEIQFVFNQ